MVIDEDIRNIFKSNIFVSNIFSASHEVEAEV